MAQDRTEPTNAIMEPDSEVATRGRYPRCEVFGAVVRVRGAKWDGGLACGLY